VSFSWISLSLSANIILLSTFGWEWEGGWELAGSYP
jgi:hypothetical protein